MAADEAGRRLDWTPAPADGIAAGAGRATGIAGLAAAALAADAAACGASAAADEARRAAPGDAVSGAAVPGAVPGDTAPGEATPGDAEPGRVTGTGPPGSSAPESRRAGRCACGTVTPNSRISRRRYVRWSPRARAVRVRLPSHWHSVDSMSRRLNSDTAP